MRRAAAIVGLVSAIAAAPAARAGDELVSPTPAPEKPPTPPDSDDYGWQVLAADLAGLGSTIALASSTNNAAALLPYLLAAPTVHALHADVQGTVGSLLLNAGVPPAAAFLGWLVDSRNCGPDVDICGAGGIAIGLIIGVGVAFGVDAVFLSHPDRPTAGASTSKPRIQVTPTIDPNRIYSLALTGRF